MSIIYPPKYNTLWVMYTLKKTLFLAVGIGFLENSSF